MNGKSQSIWKKRWNGPRGLTAWFLALAGAIFVVFYVLELISARNSKNPLLFAFIVAIAIATGVILLFALARWLFCKRNLRRTFFGFACLVTSVALFYAEENWRGHHAWQKYKRALEAKGETVDLAKLAPPPVPDEQNFAMASIMVESISAQLANGSARVKNWYGDQIAELGHTNLTNYLKMPAALTGRGLSFINGGGDWRKAEQTDLKAWQDYYRNLAAVTNFFPVAVQPQSPAEDILLALSKYDSSIADLRIASERHFSRFPVSYADENPAMILLPHLAVIKLCLYPLRLRAIAELQSSQSTNSLQDVKLMFRLTGAIRNEPILISQLVRISALQITLQPVWAGLAEHQWSDAQLIEIDSELSRLNFLADYQFAIRGERAFGTGVIDYSQRHRDWLSGLGKPDNLPTEPLEIIVSVASKAIPSGWFDQNKLSICKMYSEYLFPIVNPETRIVSPAAQRRASDVCNDSAKNPTPYNWFTRWLLGAFGLISEKFAYAQQSTDLARIACALERYRLAHDSFPETLDVLAPQFLKTIPHDIIGGQPLKYRRFEDGQFILYSVGWNETDDGGTVAFSKGKTPSVDLRNGDWVWKYPAR